MSALGNHILVDFIGCEPEIMNDVTTIEKSMVEAAQRAGATVINATFHHFSPYGVSGVVVIEESHLAIHTWPEFGYAAVDLFTCGDQVDPWVSFDYLKEVFGAGNYSALEMRRGSLQLLERKDFDMDVIRDKAQSHVNPDKYTRDVWFTDRDANQALSLRYTGEELYKAKSPYQTVKILESYGYGKMLTLDNLVMCTEKDEFHYHEMICHPVMQVHREAKRILVIGGGDGGTIREYLRYDRVEHIDMVEIDEKVVEACREHLPMISKDLDHPKLNLMIQDGIQFVADQPAEHYDVVVVDGSDPVGPAEGLFTDSFYENCQRVLKSNGVLLVQGESPKFNEKVFVELNHCLKRLFGAQKVWCELFYATTYPTGMWSFQWASKGALNPVRDLNYDEAEAFAQQENLRYYNADIHTAAFAMPTFVKQMLAQPKAALNHV